jgi:hypothetical protein
VRASVLSKSTLSQFERQHPIFAKISYKIGMHPFGLFVVNKIVLDAWGLRNRGKMDEKTRCDRQMR